MTRRPRSRGTGHPNRPRRWAALVAAGVVVVALLGACGASADPALVLVPTALGPVIGNPGGVVLYSYTSDPRIGRPSACTGDCDNDWPPVAASGDPQVGAGVDRALVATAAGANGTSQVVYAGHRLYRWAGDRVSGDLRGQGVGGTWFVVRADGSILETPEPEVSTFDDQAATTLEVISSPHGPVVADSTGAPLYAYRDDSPSRSACTASWCVGDWVPSTVERAPSAPPVITGRLARLARPDGTSQVTLGGHPLYTFAGDLHPGDFRGQGIGHDWYLVSPSGSLVTASMPAPANIPSATTTPASGMPGMNMTPGTLSPAQLAQRPVSSATLEILSPTSGQTTGTSVTLRFQVIGGEVVPPAPAGTPLVGDRGHIHVSLDGRLVEMSYGLTAQLSGLSPGLHVVQAEYVATDHLPFRNRVIAVVVFRVRG